MREGILSHMTDSLITSPTPQPDPADLVDIDALAAAGREHAKKVYPFRYVGVIWHARNSVPFGQLAGLMDDAVDGDSLDGVLDGVALFVVPEEREHFKAAILASEDVDVKELNLLARVFNEKAQENVGNAGS